MLTDQVYWIVRKPAPQARIDQLAGLEIERHTEAERYARIRVVGGRHGQIHQAHAFLGRELLALPDAVEKAPDATIVDAVGKPLACRFTVRVVRPRLALRRAKVGRRVGLITNHTGLNQDGVATADLLRAAPGVELKALFG